MITGLKVETKHDDTHVLHAIKADRNDQNQYLVYLTPNPDSYMADITQKGKVVLVSAGQNNPKLISYDFKLGRGLFDVMIATIVSPDAGECLEAGDPPIDPASKYIYPEPVMVGKTYKVGYKMEDKFCYNTSGVRIRIKSFEIPLGPDMIYYTIDRDNLREMKYFVPFKNEDQIDFFIKGVRKSEVNLHLGNPSFSLEQV